MKAESSLATWSRRGQQEYISTMAL